VIAYDLTNYDDLSTEAVTANQTREGEEARGVHVDLP
jgi:hypothetical protein